MRADESDERRWAPAKPFVHAVAIELTAFCNQHCDYCYNAWREDRGAGIGTPALATLLARIDRLLGAAAIEHVTITGGEPLASHDLFPVLDHLRAKHVRALMVSNGALVTEAIATRLARYRLMSILVTLNGPRAEVHDALVGGAHFEATVQGIRHLRKARIAVDGSIVVTTTNAALAGETVRLFASLGVKRISFGRFSAAGYALRRARELMPSPADVAIALASAAEAARATGVKLVATMPLPPCVVDRARFPEVEFHDCPIGTREQEFALGPRGDLRHCTLHEGPAGGARDVLDPALDLEAVFAPGDPDRYRAVLPAHCEGCAHASTCGGGCGAAAAWVHGDRSAPDPFVAWSADKRRLPLVV